MGPCFRCGFRDFVGTPVRSLQDLALHANTERARASSPMAGVIPPAALPLREAPRAAKEWVLRAALTPEDATDKWGMRWDDEIQRVVIPVGRGYIGRSVDGTRPKYREFGDTGGLFFAGSPTFSVLVVVEDVLSAIRVAQGGYYVAAVLGTSWSRLPCAEVYVGWFDPDRAGTKAWVRLRSYAARQDAKSARIKSEKDPKYYSRVEIRNMVEEAKMNARS